MKTNKLVSSLVLSALVLSVGAGAVSAATSATSLDGEGSVKFEKSTTVTGPTDPEKPGEIVEPITDPKEPGDVTPPVVVNPNEAAELNLDLVPNFRFGTFTDYKVSATETQKKYAKVVDLAGGEQRGSWVQVTDQRASSTGNNWELSAQLEDKFTTADGKNNLGASSISLINPNVQNDFVNNPTLASLPGATATVNLAPGAGSVKVMTAAGLAGTTTVEWGTSFDDATIGTETFKTMDTSSILNIAPQTAVTNEEYKATIKWTLSAVN